MNEQMITLVEIAGRMPKKTDLIAECRELGVHVADDWAGRPSVSVGDARSLVNGSLRSAHDHRIKEAEIRQQCKEWVRDRSAAAKDAADTAESRLRRRRAGKSDVFGAWGGLTPAEVAEARGAAYAHAGAQFERRHKRPGPYVNLAYVTPAEEGSIAAAVVGKLAGPPKAKIPAGPEVM
ncbi:hypothetical protein [Streptomyces gobiensis]|uniref:hypothetical protein n=1 Tax=Streptomyces gobiensis TaxID=2875706 RepID=UPI001E294566|nr:hypothetical protein [Streptomyces gobiensis]UGY93407.1 hypothetical protein test1122_17920 [Streptomyces gobiensis]